MENVKIRIGFCCGDRGAFAGVYRSDASLSAKLGKIRLVRAMVVVILFMGVV